MSELDIKSGLISDSAKVLPDERDQQKPAADPTKPRDELDELTQWVLNRVNQWRNHRRSNYETAWDQYERLWRSMWSTEDKNRKSERSTIVTPALGEAVENIVAEVEEAIWGRGDSFDLKAEFGADENAKKIIDDNKARLKDDLGRGDFNTNCGEALINGAVYGSGLGEIIVETFMKREIAASVEAMQPGVPPQSQLGMPAAMPPSMPTQAQPAEMRIVEKEIKFGRLQSVNPRNFLIDPIARTIDSALGVAIEEYVGAHIVGAGVRSGKYRDVEVGTSTGEPNIAPDRQVENEYGFDKVHIIRYYGLVPKHLLFPPGQTEDLSAPAPDGEGEEAGLALREAEGAAEEVFVDLGVSEGEEKPKSTDPIDSEMLEAVVIIANQGVCLKANETPYLMKDRPVVAFPWDIVPGRFWGRGVCEKGQVPQRVLDAELRARIDALAYVSAPMMGMDASRLPRGFQLTVKPGKSILTNGDPNTVLRPLHFGQLDQSTFTHSQQLDQMIQRATGSLDVIALAQRSGGDARPGAVSMMLSGIVKRHKRTLMGFVDRFYVPALRKILWRNMQFDPERYTPRNWDFVASSTMGILQREYESQNLVQLLNTMEPQSPEYKMLLMGVIANTGLTYRRDIIEMLKQSIQTAQQMQAAQAQQVSDPQMQQMQNKLGMAGAQLQLAEINAKIRELESRANLQDVKAQNAQMEPRFRMAEIATKGIYQVAADQQDREFSRRMQMTDQMLKERDIASNERIATTQSVASVASERVKARAQILSAHASAGSKVVGEHMKARSKVTGEHIKGLAAIATTPPPPQQLQGRSASLVE